jgi:hypothetical protein
MQSISTQADTTITINFNEIDDEYYVDEQIQMQLNQYLTTTLIVRRNITLGDLFLTTFNTNEFE